MFIATDFNPWYQRNRRKILAKFLHRQSKNYDKIKILPLKSSDRRVRNSDRLTFRYTTSNKCEISAFLFLVITAFEFIKNKFRLK